MNDLKSPLHTLASVRNEFPGASLYTYLETSARGLIPAGAREAVSRDLESRILEGGDKDAMFDTISGVRRKFAELINADENDIAIVKNVSEGVNAIVASLPWQQGDNAVLCGEVEHPNATYALYNMRDRYGIEVRSVPARNYAIPVDEFLDTIDERTRLVILSSVPFTTGLRTDLAAIGEACRKRNIFVHVDGAQSVGVLHTDVRSLPIDGLTVSASKYLCGPYGVGFLYVRKERADALQPAYLARYGIDLGDVHEGEQGGSQYELMPGARRFDLGSYCYIAAAAVEVTLDLLLKVGTPAIEQHALFLSQYFTDGLHSLGLRIVGGAHSQRSQVVLIEEPAPGGKRMPSMQDLYDHLSGNRVKLSIRHGRLRFSFHLYNTVDDVDRVLALLRARLDLPGR